MDGVIEELIIHEGAESAAAERDRCVRILKRLGVPKSVIKAVNNLEIEE